jgi:uncharacterized membrane protein HdeD (DUF308 family)
MKNHYWILLIQGIIAIVFGVILILWPVKTLLAATWIIGAFLLLTSVAAILYSFLGSKKSKKETSHIILIQGILALVFGIVLIANPETVLKFLVLIFAIWSIASGIIQVFRGLFGGGESAEAIRIHIFSGLFSIFVGVLLFVFPIGTITFVQILIGLAILVNGISTVIYTYKLK